MQRWMVMGMARCKDCLHYKACSAFSKIINAAVDVEKGCEHFDNRTKVYGVVICGDCVFRKATPSAYKLFGWNCTNKRSPCRNRIVSDVDFCPYRERKDHG